MTRISNKKKKGLAGLYIQPTIKRYHLATRTSISEKCQIDKKVRIGKQSGKLMTLALNWCNIWLTKPCIYLGVITCCKTHIFNTDAYLKFHEGEGNLVAQCTLISVCNCYSRGLTWAVTIPCYHCCFTGVILLILKLPIFPSSSGL